MAFVEAFRLEMMSKTEKVHSLELYDVTDISAEYRDELHAPEDQNEEIMIERYDENTGKALHY